MKGVEIEIEMLMMSESLYVYVYAAVFSKQLLHRMAFSHVSLSSLSFPLHRPFAAPPTPISVFDNFVQLQNDQQICHICICQPR